MMKTMAETTAPLFWRKRRQASCHRLDCRILAALRPDLTFGELRGNIPTRLERAAGFDAVVVAAAALDRLGLAERATERLEPSVLLPQVGQGGLAVECRGDDVDALDARDVAEPEVHAQIVLSQITRS